ncbi:DDB1- and CUL4-associated factor 13 [Nematocida parisii]|uniref:WD repeat and SOF domain-containing protein 1 n=1 Tax=Nematocida parisii (strain ERTm3) TaxID=935791 RepID=I3EDC5_NEMP3|nr:uncharacterized protein NEPG_00604 [Nematocida parisii ERTm1]EIJ87222.1 hypothetical protein NEQG_02557 [Nematocida parisii ERTm3]KAI5126606.1 DDB1- and CUL4-associated factor 13 [Nematocida parisii]EIJ95079.1 hypothetical protein NEPG_00604 [Nematocida parisii ERTm1]KAI5127889.1 DDB1- and CUL4-associated factor 13 [Nematocida parisii]KAI5143172.1 DDB1- and CUL4-associated factor 13 [Nematocida parisii]|eukprot:XP_013058435.1 hypothetical protein NEPG_00604 [Nematocida parisii ERTm1]
MGIHRIATLDRGSRRGIQARVFSDKELTQNEKHKEYMRAVKEVKLDHIFRKPFIDCLGGHTEGVTRIVRSTMQGELYASTSYDGTVKVWNMSKREEMETISLNQNTPVALSFLNDALLYSSGSNIFHRDVKYSDVLTGVQESLGSPDETEFIAGSGVLDIAGAGGTQFYASTVDGIEIFDKNRIKAVASYKGERQAKRLYISKNDMPLVYAIEGNKIVGYDNRTGKSEIEIVAKAEINAMSIDPMSPETIAAGTNNGEIYMYNTYYTGNSSTYITPPSRTLRGHTTAITDIEHSANGTRIVTGSTDRTVRIFTNDVTHRQEALYHNRRMQGVNAICCTSDNAYILSGSVDTNIRIWKLDPNSSTKICTRAEEDSRALGNVVKNKYRDVMQIEDTKRHQIVPRKIKKAMKNRYNHIKAEAKKELRRQNHGIIPEELQKK